MLCVQKLAVQFAIASAASVPSAQVVASLQWLTLSDSNVTVLTTSVDSVNRVPGGKRASVIIMMPKFVPRCSQVSFTLRHSRRVWELAL